MGAAAFLQCVAAVVGIVAGVAGLAWTIHKAGMHNLLRTIGLMLFAVAGVSVLGFVLWGIIARNLSRSPAAGEVITNSIGMKLALIPAGEFMMGSPESEEGRDSAEKQHRVRITRPFYLGVYEVTQAEYERVMGTNPSYFKGATRPVEQVSWDNAVEFCRKLSAQEGRTYRLPTEAEWEYACRAGTQTPFHFGSQLNGREANCNGNYPYGTQTNGPYLERTTEVGSYRPNAWGLYDMHGNVWEWCQDRHDGDYYANSPTDDPQGPSLGSLRVLRGGGWAFIAWSCRSAFRNDFAPGYEFDYLGFRAALVPAE